MLEPTIWGVWTASQGCALSQAILHTDVTKHNETMEDQRAVGAAVKTNSYRAKSSPKRNQSIVLAVLGVGFT